MKRKTILLVASACILLLGGCKGRTADNMVPNGDTVEVIINNSYENQTDTILEPDSSVDSQRMLGE